MSWSGLPATDASVLSSAAFFNQFLGAIRERGVGTNYTRTYPRVINPASPPAGSNGQRAWAAGQNSSATADASGVTPPIVYQHNGSSWAVAANQKTDVDRLTTASSSAVALPGDYCGIVQSGANSRGWRYIQTTVEGMAPFWVDSANSGPDYDMEDVLGSGPYSSDIPLYTLASWRAASGINSNGFTRKLWRTINVSSPPAGTNGQRAYAGSQNSNTTGSATGATSIVYQHNGSSWAIAADQTADVDVLTKYGLAQTGDLIGIHIPNELYAGLNNLRWTLYDNLVTATGVARISDEEEWNGSTGGSTYATAALAQAAAEAALAAGGTGQPPNYYNVFINLAAQYGAVLDFKRQKFQFINPLAVDAEVDFYIGTGVGTSGPAIDVYDPAPIGATSSYQNKLYLAETLAVSAGGSPKTGWHGSDISTPPDPPADPTNPGNVESIRGYRNHVVSAVARWDVSGGFVYIA